MIIPIPFFAAFAITYASYITRFGTLKVTEINTANPINKTLILSDYKLLTSELMSVFSLDSSGTLLQFGGPNYLVVDAKGKLVLSEAFELGIQVAEEPDNENLREVSFRGNTIFQICDDGLVGYNSNCLGARNAKILYDDLFH